MKNIPCNDLGEIYKGLGDLALSERRDNEEIVERLRRNLRRARVRELTQRQEEVVRLYYEESMSIGEIAKEMGVNRSTVYRTLERAKKKLRQFLQYSF